jgi:hypothetical protein
MRGKSGGRRSTKRRYRHSLIRLSAKVLSLWRIVFRLGRLARRKRLIYFASDTLQPFFSSFGTLTIRSAFSFEPRYAIFGHAQPHLCLMRHCQSVLNILLGSFSRLLKSGQNAMGRTIHSIVPVRKLHHLFGQLELPDYPGLPWPEPIARQSLYPPTCKPPIGRIPSLLRTQADCPRNYCWNFDLRCQCGEIWTRLILLQRSGTF